MRQWTCSVCQAVHDRDTNAAKNILARGLVEWERDFSTAGEAKAVEAAVNEVVGASAITGAGHGPLDAGIPFQVASSNLEGEDVKKVIEAQACMKLEHDFDHRVGRERAVQLIQLFAAGGGHGHGHA